MFSLQPPRHIPTLPIAEAKAAGNGGRFLGKCGPIAAIDRDYHFINLEIVQSLTCRGV